MKCGVCDGRMVAQTGTRKKDGKTYLHGFYYCAAAPSKGETVCTHVTRCSQKEVEQTILDRFSAATTDEHLDELARRVNKAVERLFQHDPERERWAKTEIKKQQERAQRLAQAIAEGISISAVRTELSAIQARIGDLENELLTMNDSTSPPAVHPELLKHYVADLRGLIETNLPKAKAEIIRHLDGDLVLRPEAAPAGERAFSIEGRVTAAGLLGPLSGPEGQLAARTVYCGGRI